MLTLITLKRLRGHPVSGAELSAEAIALNERFGGSPDFVFTHIIKVLNEYLICNVILGKCRMQKFKARHGLRKLKLCGEKMLADTEATNDFILKF